MISAVCPNPRCGRSLRFKARSFGQEVACPHCRQAFQVDVMPADAPTAPEEISNTPWLPGSDVPTGPMSGTPPRPPTPPRRSTSGGPPPLPRRPLRTGPLIVSAVSVLVTLGSVVGIVLLLRSPTPEADPPPTPAAATAERWAAITIESRGVRLVIIDGKRSPNNPELRLVTAADRDWKLGEVPPTGRPPSFDDLERLLKGYKEILATQGVSADRRLVACNGGAVTAGGKGNEEKVRGWVKEAVKKALDLDVEIVEAADEAEYGARGCIPPVAAVRTQSVALDVGNGSVKHGYFDTPKTFKGDKFGIGVGKATADIDALAKGRKLPFPAAARAWKAETADAAVAKLADGTPPLRNHERFYLLGGAPWAVAVLSHPAEFAKPIDERVVDIKLSPADIDGVLKLAEEKADFAAVKAAVLAQVPAENRAPLDAEVTAVGRAFLMPQLTAGATLLKSFSDVCKFEGKQVWFYTRSLHAWPVGYILVKGKFE